MGPELILLMAIAADWREGMRLVGDARWRGETLRLNPPEEMQAGGAWRRDKVAIAGGFATTFRFRISQNGGLGDGADGLAFVMQNTGPEALAGRGGAGGFAVEGPGLSGKRRKAIGNSIAVFFDTFENAEVKDPSNNYVGVYSFGRPEKAKWPPPRQGYSPRLRVDLKDGQEHEVRIRFEPPLLEVRLDGERVLETSVEVRTVADAEGKAWVGFTGATGNGWEAHDVIDWRFESVESNMTSVDSQISFATADCMPDRNLCTPKEATVEAKGDGVFAVVLPGNVEWGASVPNPDGKRVEIRNTGGYVCWGPAECSGAEGGLRMKTEKGKTFFGVDGKGRSVARNEGYFAFEAVLRD